MDKEEKKKALKRYFITERRVVIRYKDDYGKTNYFIVKRSEKGQIYGQIASHIAVNSLSLDDLIKKDFAIAEFKELGEILEKKNKAQ